MKPIPQCNANERYILNLSYHMTVHLPVATEVSSSCKMVLSLEKAFLKALELFPYLDDLKNEQQEYTKVTTCMH